MTVSIRYLGDRNQAMTLRRRGLQQLDILKNLMSFQDLKQDWRKVCYDDGTIIQCSSIFGIDRVNIYVPEARKIEEIIPEYLLPFATFRKDGAFYAMDFSGPPFVFKNWRALNLSGDDLYVMVDRQYWRCEGGKVYKGHLGVNLVSDQGEIECTGLEGAHVYSAQVYTTDSGYEMLYQYDTVPVELGNPSVIVRAPSNNGIDWTGNTTIIDDTLCDHNEIEYGLAHEDMNAGYFDYGDTYFVENLEIPIDGRDIRIVRIGRKYRFTTAGNFSPYEGWSMLGRSESGGIVFIEEDPCSFEGIDISEGEIQLLQLVRGYMTDD